MTIKVDQKEFENKKQALIELAFCHYPVKVIIDDKEYTFNEFSTLEDFIKNYKEKEN